MRHLERRTVLVDATNQTGGRICFIIYSKIIVTPSDHKPVLLRTAFIGVLQLAYILVYIYIYILSNLEMMLRKIYRADSCHWQMGLK